jgi:hypothetical protein
MTIPNFSVNLHGSKHVIVFTNSLNINFLKIMWI